MCALFVVSSQRWRCHTNAVTVRARYLPCFVATLVLYVHAVSSRRWSCQKNQSLYVHVISSRRWSCQKNQSLYVHVICSKLVLRKTSLCMYTLFVPSWCSDKPVSVYARYLFQVGAQINQSLQVIFYVLTQRWCCQINQSLCVHVICCPVTTLVLSEEPASI